ncbi:MAG: 3-dehydroquinate synthase [Myxococcota bacterium]
MSSAPGETQGRLRSVQVPLGERTYPVHIGLGTLSDVGGEIARHTGAHHAVVVTVPAVGRRYAKAVLGSLRDAGLRVDRVDVPDGDAAKNLRQVERLYGEFIRRNVDRGSAVVALGGGMVGDLAGFTAATFLRGVPFVQVPTTILAMVDASIGGKVGVNLRQGKNLVGAFHQPKLVWIDAATLRSLPRRQRAAGLAEVIKAGAIWDARFFAQLERDAERLMDLDPAALLPVLERACAIKAEVVSRDEREGGLRMLLNFGHTLAHAVETLSGYRRVLHGEAVAMGMVFGAERSEGLGLAPAGTAERIAVLLRRIGLPTQLPAFPRRAYLAALKVDKKRRDASIHYVVLKEIGRAEILPLAPAEIVLPGWRAPGAAPRRTGGRRSRRVPARRR